MIPARNASVSVNHELKSTDAHSQTERAQRRRRKCSHSTQTQSHGSSRLKARIFVEAGVASAMDVSGQLEA